MVVGVETLVSIEGKRKTLPIREDDREDDMEAAVLTVPILA